MSKIIEKISGIKEMIRLFYMVFAYDLYYKGEYLVWVKRFGKPYCAFMENQSELNPVRLMGRLRRREFLPDFPREIPIQIAGSYSLDYTIPWFKKFMRKDAPFTSLANFVLSADERYLPPRSKKRVLDALESIAHLTKERERIEYLRTLYS